MGLSANSREILEMRQRLNAKGISYPKTPEQISQAMALSRRRLDHQMIQEFAADTQEIYSPQMRAF